MSRISSAPRSLFRDTPPPSPPEKARFLSRDACEALAKRIFALASPGSLTELNLYSGWTGTLRWARNVTIMSSDSQETRFAVRQTDRGASSEGFVITNSMEDAELKALVRRAERMTELNPLDPDQYPVPYPDVPPVVHPCAQPSIWFDRTYNLDADARGAALEPLVALASAAGVLAAGYLEASADAHVVLHRADGLFRYYPRTQAQYSVTVRDPKAGGSGWAGVDFSDWARIDADTLTRTAIEKCERSRHPVAVEPGPYTTILEPQAVCDMLMQFVPFLDRSIAEQGRGPFAGERGSSKIGQRVLDRRLTLSADPMDPDLGFVPFDGNGEPYVDTTWIEHGVLKELSYSRRYAQSLLDSDWGRPNPFAFRLEGGTTTMSEMIADTDRGILITRFNNVQVIDMNSMLMTGNTRDGLWLIEKGKIAKAIRNFRFTDSPLFVFNNVEQIGVSQRVFHPATPVVCPPVKVRDFSFTALMDGV